jgi:hypothetical protein
MALRHGRDRRLRPSGLTAHVSKGMRPASLRKVLSAFILWVAPYNTLSGRRKALPVFLRYLKHALDFFR